MGDTSRSRIEHECRELLDSLRRDIEIMTGKDVSEHQLIITALRAMRMKCEREGYEPLVASGAIDSRSGSQ